MIERKHPTPACKVQGDWQVGQAGDMDGVTPAVAVIVGTASEC